MTIEINSKGGILKYAQREGQLPSLALIRVFQNAILQFCQSCTSDQINYEATFYGEPSIVFFDQSTRQIVIFNKEDKSLVSAYRIDETRMKSYLATNILGKKR